VRDIQRAQLLSNMKFFSQSLGVRWPWGLVLLGVMIALVLEMSGIPSLAFAVGVYLPISSSAPVFVGGAVRWLVDRKLRHELREHKLDEAQLAAWVKQASRLPGEKM